MKIEPIACDETSVRNYHYSLPTNPEERSSRLLHGSSSKSRKDNEGYVIKSVIPYTDILQIWPNM
jgi:hypothetical protein